MKYFKPKENSKSHLAKLQKELERGSHLLKCKKCGESRTTLRCIVTDSAKDYYCESCLKKAMISGKDIRFDFIDEKEEDMKKSKKSKLSEGQVTMFDEIDKDLKDTKGDKKC